MKTVIGVLLLIGGVGFGGLALLQLLHWADLSADGNPFADAAFDPVLYLGGVAATAFLCGLGFLFAVPDKR